MLLSKDPSNLRVLLVRLNGNVDMFAMFSPSKCSMLLQNSKSNLVTGRFCYLGSYIPLGDCVSNELSSLAQSARLSFNV